MSKMYLGVDIGGTAVKLGLVDENGQVVSRAERSVSFDGYKTPILDTVTAAIRDFIAPHDAPALAGIGVSATGQIDSRRGVVACTCGAIGCYERYAATTALVRSAQKAGLGLPDGRAIFEAAAAGDARTLAVVNAWVGEIAQGLAGLVHIFNPQLILIGGGVSAQQELLIDPLAEKVRASVMPAFAEGLELKSAALQNDAGLVGAVYYFKKHHD